MLGFIKKDLLMIKSNFKILGFLIVFYIIMGFMGQMDISFILPFMCVMIMISTFSYDTFNNWDAYAVALPNGRLNSVKAKYLATILLIVVTAFLMLILSVIMAYSQNTVINWENIIFTLLGSVFGTILSLSFMFPIIYKMGIEKARICIFVGVFGIIILGGLLFKYVNLAGVGAMLAKLENYWPLIILAACGLIPYISYRISLKIYLKKEF